MFHIDVVRAKLQHVLSDKAREAGEDYTKTYIDSIDSGTQTFIYRQGERLLRRGWTVDSGGIVTLEPNTVDVQRETTFLPVPGTVEVAEPEDDEIIYKKLVALPTAVGMVLKGTIRDAKTISSVLWLDHMLKRNI